MKKVGVLGGLSYESTALYYRELARYSQYYTGINTSCGFLIYQVNTYRVITATSQAHWDGVLQELLFSIRQLMLSSVNAIVIPCNTLHFLLPRLQSEISIPILNIMDSVGRYCIKNNIRKALLLGSRFTMESGFYASYLQQKFNIDIVTPSSEWRHFIHYFIFYFLCHGVVSQKVRKSFLKYCEQQYQHTNIDAVIFGCTELSILKDIGFDCPVKLIDALSLHVKAIIEFSVDQG